MFEDQYTQFKTSLLALLLSPSRLTVSQLESLLSQPEELLRICSQHRLHSWVLRSLRQSTFCKEFLSSPVGEMISNAARAESMRALLANAELVRLVKLLGQHAIELMPLKGAHLANFVYPSLEMRPMRDLDITLMDPARSIEAFQILIEAGYNYPKEFEYDLEQCLVDKKHLPALVSPSRLYFVEIHTSLYDSEMGREKHLNHLEQLKANQRMRSLPISEQKLWLMSNEDLFIHIAVHSAKESKFSNGPVCFQDLQILVNSAGFDWDKLINIAQQLGHSRSVALVSAVLMHLDPNLKTSDALQGLIAQVPLNMVLISLRNSLCDTRIKPKQKILMGSGSLLAKSSLLKAQVLPSRQQLENLYPKEKNTVSRYLRHSHKVATQMIPKWMEGKKGLNSLQSKTEVNDWQLISQFVD